MPYHRTDEHLSIPSTAVLPTFRGFGLASEPVQHVMAEGRREGWAVTTTSWYVQDWMAEHADYR